MRARWLASTSLGRSCKPCWRIFSFSEGSGKAVRLLCRGVMERGGCEEEHSGVMEWTLEGTEDPVDVADHCAARTSLCILSLCTSSHWPSSFHPISKTPCLLWRNTGSFLSSLKSLKGLWVEKHHSRTHPKGGMFFSCREKLLTCHTQPEKAKPDGSRGDAERCLCSCFFLLLWVWQELKVTLAYPRLVAPRSLSRWTLNPPLCRFLCPGALWCHWTRRGPLMAVAVGLSVYFACWRGPHRRRKGGVSWPEVCVCVCVCVCTHARAQAAVHASLQV